MKPHMKNTAVTTPKARRSRPGSVRCMGDSSGTGRCPGTIVVRAAPHQTGVPRMSIRISPVLCLTAALVSVTAYAATPGEEAWSSVDPFIGTGEGGHTYPGASLPFGMVQLSPDTDIKDFHKSYKWAAGYLHEDSTILGFSHTHFSG